MGCFLPDVGNLHAMQIVSIVALTMTGEQKYISLWLSLWRHSDMCFLEHISPVKCISPTQENIPLEICLSRVGKHVSLGMWVRGKTYHGETHITVTLQRYVFPRTMCFPEHISLLKWVSPTRQHTSLRIRFRGNTSDQTLSVYFPG